MVKLNKEEEYFEIEKVYSVGDEVKNIGYPAKDTKEILEHTQIKKQFNQSGKILRLNANYFMNANDVRLASKKVIILDYSSELGFSGGPLLKGGKVIGVMSHLYPQNGNVVAISIEEVQRLLK